MSKPAIRVSGVAKMYRIFHSRRYQVMDLLGLRIPASAYDAFWALRDIDLVVPQGGKIGIVGHNGAGKSTLLKIIAGQISATEGEISVRGKVQALMELGTGFHPEFTGRENVFTALSYQGVVGSQAKTRFEEILDFSELYDFIDNPIKTYSGGMYARLAFSVATAIEPEILIIDEVLGAGDAYFAAKCVERMRTLTEGGATVLFVSHDMASVQRLCDQAIWINRGRIVGTGETLEICKRYMKDVRNREESRLRAANMRLQRGATEIAATIENHAVTMILHFVVEGWGIPKEAHPISRIALSKDGETLAEVNVGDAADNDVSQRNHVIVQRSYIDWGEPIRLHGRYCREFKDMGGRYRHAALQMSAEICELEPDGNLEIQLDYFDQGREPFHLEIFDDKTYQRIGTVVPSGRGQWRTSHWNFRVPTKYKEINELKEERERSKRVEDIIDILGGGEAEIQSIRLIGDDGQERNVFRLGEKITVEVQFVIHKDLHMLLSALVIYTADGITVFKDLADPELDKYAPSVYGHSWIFDPSPFGPRDYVISAALYRNFDLSDDSRLQPAYSLWDRRVRFKVEQPLGVAIELGLLCSKPQKRFFKK